MKSSFGGIVFGGAIQLNEPIDMADRSPVHVTVIPIEQWKSQWTKALTALDRLKSTQPLRPGSLRFTREQLHERH